MEEKDQKALLDKVNAEAKKACDEANKGNITSDELKTKLDALKEQLPLDKTEEIKALTEKFEAMEKTIDEQKETIDKQGEELTSLKEKGGSEKNITLKDSIAEALKSEDIAKYLEKPVGRSGEMEIKVVDMTSDYSGTTMISSTSNRVLDHPANRSLNIRDLMTVLPTDMSIHTYPEVYTWDKNVAMEAENGTLNESSFLVREKETGTKRLGTYIKISKRMLRNVKWLTAHLASKLPDALKFVEDFQFIFGDGNSNNIDGLARNADAFDLTYATYSAGDFTSIAQYGTNAAADDNTLLTYTAAHGLSNGDILTLANTTGTTYDGDHIVTVVDATKVLLNQAYTADANVLANWTGSAKNALYHNVDGAQDIDVLFATIAILKRGEYQATGIIINPIQGALIRMIKSTTEDYVQGAPIEVINGITYIAGVPLLETNAMPSGYFLAGDFQKAVELLQFTNMTLEFADDVSYKLANQVAVIIQEEVIMPIYNKYMFIYGDFATAKTELETP